jgi:hypothetical protein
MLNGISHDRRHRITKHHYDRLCKKASAMLRQATQFQSARDLACKVPLVVGAIVVLLIINTTLQYVAGPSLQHVLPTQEGKGGPQLQPQAAAEGLARHIPKGLVTNVIPGGADAELLCIDKQAACDKQ